jgi:hypothetical protein
MSRLKSTPIVDVVYDLARQRIEDLQSDAARGREYKRAADDCDQEQEPG